jgi:hypothetical protein
MPDCAPATIGSPEFALVFGRNHPTEDGVLGGIRTHDPNCDATMTSTRPAGTSSGGAFLFQPRCRPSRTGAHGPRSLRDRSPHRSSPHAGPADFPVGGATSTGTGAGSAAPGGPAGDSRPSSIPSIWAKLVTSRSPLIPSAPSLFIIGEVVVLLGKLQPLPLHLRVSRCIGIEAAALGRFSVSLRDWQLLHSDLPN